MKILLEKINVNVSKKKLFVSKLKKMVGLAELESATSPLSGVRSNQLSYRPITNGKTIVQEIDLDSKRKFNFAASASQSSQP